MTQIIALARQMPSPLGIKESARSRKSCNMAPMPTHSLRIKGLVAAVTRLREQLRDGIEAGQIEAFRHNVTHTLVQMGRLCREHGITPAQLPRPSHQAYAFLKTIDLERLPIRDGNANPATPPLRPVRIKNLLSICDRVQSQLDRIVEQAPLPEAPLPEAPPPDHTADLSHPDVARVLHSITVSADQVEAICRESASSPARLPAQSRRAYQWLRFLSDPANLATHLTTLSLLRQLLDQTDWAKDPRLAGREIHVELFHSSVTYRVRPAAQTITLTMAEGFSGAPREVLKALLQATLTPPHEKALRDVAMRTIKTYTQSDDFAEVASALETMAEPPQEDVRGRRHDLGHVFERVNVAYFGGAMPRPRLAWSKALTARKLGHYQFATDTVMISLTLDDPRVPEPAIDLVMYHEMLHKQMGAHLVNGRRYVHTEAFRQAERHFEGYAEVKALLDGLNAVP